MSESRASQKKGRTLSNDEQQLWKRVTDTVSSITNKPAPIAEEKNVFSAQKQYNASSSKTLPINHVESRQTPKSSLPTIDRRTRGMITRGRQEIGASIDLHGLRQTEAYAVLRKFLANAQQSGTQFVIVITGKGKSSTDEGIYESSFKYGHGVLRTSVPHWLATEDLRRYVIGYCEAGRRHGGAGALYIQIRRRKNRFGHSRPEESL